jgi:hypothetical protein
VAPPKTKAELKKKKVTDALFGGISGTKKESSDSSEDSD